MADDLKTRIGDDVKTAMRARDSERLGTLRQVTAAIKQVEVDSRTELDDAGVLAVLEKMLKQRRESLAAYENAAREDLAATERAEIEIISTYMPAALAATEIEAMVDAAVGETGAASMRDMGKVMGVLKGRMQGRADMGAVSALVKARLSG